MWLYFDETPIAVRKNAETRNGEGISECEPDCDE